MKATTFLVESPVWNIVIGGVLLLAFGVPTLLVLRGYITGAPCGVARSSQPACLLITSIFLLVGIGALTRRDSATVDPAGRSICWESSTFGFTYSSARWYGPDLKAIEIREYPHNRSSPYWTATFIRGPKGERLLFADDLDSVPDDARRAIDDLELPLTRTKV